MPATSTAARRCHACAEPALPGTRHCAACAARKRDDYWAKVRAGLCTRCGLQPPRQDRRTCFACALLMSAYGQARSAREKAAQICRTCHHRPTYGRRAKCLRCYSRSQRRLGQATLMTSGEH